MKEYEQEDPIPQGDLALQLTALPRETNGFGDIYGGWLVSQMDLAGTAMASRVAAGRVATVSIDRMAFMVPVAVGAQLSFYTQTLEVGRSSIAVLPFTNLSEDSANDYFSDGMSEELINLLTRVPGLQVAARTSSSAASVTTRSTPPGAMMRRIGSSATTGA